MDIQGKELALARVDRAADCMNVKPRDMLIAMLHDIDTGKLKCDGLLLVYVNRPVDGPWSIGSYRANMSRDAEIVALHMRITEATEQWRKPDGN